MNNPALTPEDWRYIHDTLESRATRQDGKLRNARRKGSVAKHLVQYLEQDTKRARDLAKKVAP